MKENFQPLTEELYDLAFCPREKYEDLKCLAAPEDWGAELNVLKSYIRYLYKRIARVHNENHGESYLVYQIPTMLCFDTGLFTSRYESIYAVFEPNIKEGKQPWYLKNFLRKSDKGLENILDFPERARFYEDPSDLIYDYRCPLRVNIEHILGDEDNLARIPLELQGDQNVSLLRRVFKGAVEEAENRVKANYTLAIPQYYNDSI